MKIRVVELDLLRFLAASAVMLFHYTYALNLTNGATNVFPNLGRIMMHGHLGVPLFFMISGFVIAWSVCQRQPSQFLVSRITRLYPEFWIGVVLSTIIFTHVGAQDIATATVLANLTMIPHFFGQSYVDEVYWTLFIELKFYALLWILSIMRQIPHLEIWLYVWFIVTSLSFIFDTTSIVRSIIIYPYSPLFIAGCLFFLIRTDGITFPRVIVILGCFCLALVAMINILPGMLNEDSSLPMNVITESMIILGAFFICFAAISILYNYHIPFSSIIIFLGTLTYPLYLIHNIGKVLVLNPLAVNYPYIALACAVMFSFVLAGLINFLVDRYWRKQFAHLLTELMARFWLCWQTLTSSPK